MRSVVTIQAALEERIHELEANNPPSGSHMANQSLTTGVIKTSSLPKIPIPPFSGDFGEWRAFSDLFVSLIGDTATISNAEKFVHLRNSLAGNAASIISNIKVSADAFQVAWDLLVRSSDTLNALLNTVSESLNSLKALGAPVEQWDSFVVHLLAQHLDLKTREDWEMHLGPTTEYPSLVQLTDFITGTARALESIEGQSRPSSSHAKHDKRLSQPARVHHVSSDEPPSHSETKPFIKDLNNTCNYCGKSHFMAFCPTFSSMTDDQKMQLVKQERLCYNCLGRHNVYRCKNTQSCKVCSLRHHTHLHGVFAEDAKGTISPPSATTSTVTTPAQITATYANRLTSLAQFDSAAIPANSASQ